MFPIYLKSMNMQVDFYRRSMISALGYRDLGYSKSEGEKEMPVANEVTSITV